MTHYDILGVTAEAGHSEIKSNYRSLVKQYHPDLNPSEEAKVLILRITEAYSVLSDPAKKHIYDLQLAGVEELIESFAEDRIDEREQYRREYVRRKREQEEHKWQQLFIRAIAC